MVGELLVEEIKRLQKKLEAIGVNKRLDSFAHKLWQFSQSSLHLKRIVDIKLAVHEKLTSNPELKTVHEKFYFALEDFIQESVRIIRRDEDEFEHYQSGYPPSVLTPEYSKLPERSQIHNFDLFKKVFPLIPRRGNYLCICLLWWLNSAELYVKWLNLNVIGIKPQSREEVILYRSKKQRCDQYCKLYRSLLLSADAHNGYAFWDLNLLVNHTAVNLENNDVTHIHWEILRTLPNRLEYLHVVCKVVLDDLYSESVIALSNKEVASRVTQIPQRHKKVEIRIKYYSVGPYKIGVNNTCITSIQNLQKAKDKPKLEGQPKSLLFKFLNAPEYTLTLHNVSSLIRKSTCNNKVERSMKMVSELRVQLKYLDESYIEDLDPRMDHPMMDKRYQMKAQAFA